MASDYQAEIAKYQAESETKLKSDTGWLTVAGLFWLEPGKNVVGTAKDAAVRLPEGSAAERVGVIEFSQGKATWVSGGNRQVLTSDEGEQEPDVVKLNDRLTFFIIKRGQRWAVRLRDQQSPMRKEFTQKHWFPIDEKYRVVATWTPYEKGKTMPVPNILNEIEQSPCPGKATFLLDGKEFSLEPVLEGKQLFFIFRDQTAGHETYTPGRFFYTDLPVDGKVVLDFNKAYNPPCAFTPYATCPLPPKQNWLAIRVEAGELKYGDH